MGRLLEHTQYLSVIDSGIFQSGASKREVGDGNKAYLSPTVAWLTLENVIMWVGVMQKWRLSP